MTFEICYLDFLSMINFMKYRWLYFLISAVIILPGTYHLIRFGLVPAIDFTGGTLLELRINSEKSRIDEVKIREVAGQNEVGVATFQTTNQNSVILRMKPLESGIKEKLMASFSGVLGEVEEVRYESVGPTLGKELLQKTFIAAILATLAILSYVAYAFKNIRYGTAAVLALLHDLLVVIGTFAILGKYLGVEVDALFVTAVLTTMSFSVHDTIVVFDRIRETQKRKSGLPFETVINQALTETMTRSLNNSLTIIFMLLALFLMGGETTKWFVLALLIGTLSGTYSSPFVATPVLYTWSIIKRK